MHASIHIYIYIHILQLHTHILYIYIYIIIYITDARHAGALHMPQKCGALFGIANVQRNKESRRAHHNQIVMYRNRTTLVKNIMNNRFDVWW